LVPEILTQKRKKNRNIIPKTPEVLASLLNEIGGR
jgi:hypothetical protein